MVLGFIIYEAFDIVYHIGKIGYNGIKFGYDSIFSPNKERNDVNINEESMVRIAEMEKKIAFLEELFDKRYNHMIEKVDTLSSTSTLSGRSSFSTST